MHRMHQLLLGWLLQFALPVWIALPKGITHKLNNKTEAEILLFVWLHST